MSECSAAGLGMLEQFTCTVSSDCHLCFLFVVNMYFVWSHGPRHTEDKELLKGTESDSVEHKSFKNLS